MRIPIFFIRSLLEWLKRPDSQPQTKRYATEAEIRERNALMARKRDELTALYAEVNAMYHSRACPCAFPRFQQIIGINCSTSGDLYRSMDTELLMQAVKDGFDVTESERTDEAVNKRWTCNTCGSAYEFGWSDFSIAIDRDKLELVNLCVEQVGKEAHYPTPVYIGAMGHSLPGDTEQQIVSLGVFSDYMLEQ